MKDKNMYLPVIIYHNGLKPWNKRTL